MRCAECSGCRLYKRNVAIVATRKASLDASRARAKQFVESALKEFRVGRKDLCESRFPEHTKLRRIVMRRMKDAGLGSIIIAQAMGMNVSTVRYWLNPGYRAARIERERASRVAAHQTPSSEATILGVILS